jgi:magnesium transporter
LLQVRRYIMPLRESIGQLARGEYAFIGKNIQPYFRDALDHLVRTTEMLDLYRDQVIGARDVYMSALSQRTNEAMKTLTLFATVMMPLTLISGIYGMNFEQLWPPTNHPYGFWMIIGGMAGVSAGLVYFFRRKRLL